MSFCPRFFHEPRRFDFARCSFPLLVVLVARGVELASVRVLASAKPAEAASRHKRAAKTVSKRVNFFGTATTESIPRMLGKGPNTSVASSIISRLDARRHSGVHLGNVTEVYRPGRWYRRFGPVPGVPGRQRLVRSSGWLAP